MANWKTLDRGHEHGPVSTEQLSEAVESGQVHETAHVREEPGGAWQTLRDSPFGPLMPKESRASTPNLGRVAFAVWCVLVLVSIWLR